MKQITKDKIIRTVKKALHYEEKQPIIIKRDEYKVELLRFENTIPKLEYEYKRFNKHWPYIIAEEFAKKIVESGWYDIKFEPDFENNGNVHIEAHMFIGRKNQ